MKISFQNPNSLEVALHLLASSNYTLLAGGTDFYPALQERRPKENVLDITQIHSLRAITDREDYLEIGAGVTWSDLIKADLPHSFDGLKLAAREVGSQQIQNRATIVGNICNASPAADGVPPLLTLDASVCLSSIHGERIIPLSEFITGNRETAIRPDELVTSLHIPKHAMAGASSFRKLGARKYLVISISMVAVRLMADQANLIQDAAISVGACSLVAKRLSSLEADLVGKEMSNRLIDSVEPQHLSALSPIDDVRATAQYRVEASVELVKRTISDLMGA